MTSQLKFLALLPLGLALGAACTAGDDIVPDANGGSGGSGSVLPMGGSSGSGPAAGTSSTTGGSSAQTGGSGGSGQTGGSAGTAGTGQTGGSAGTGGTGVVAEDLNAAVAVWNGWRVDMLCANDPGKTFLSENCQQGGDICNMKDDNSGRTMFTIEKTMAGDPKKIYKFKVRVRGVVEPKAFDPNNCEPLFMGDNVPMRACKCKDPACIPLESGFNWMQLNIESPKQRYYMNNAKDSVSHRVEVMDGQFEIEARGGTKITYFFDNLNTGEIRNCQNKVAPDLPFVDGNFFIFDVLPGTITATDAPL